MASAGFLCLAAALAISLYGIGASLYGARAGRREFVDSGRRAVYAMAGMLVVAMLILQLAFVRSDFSFELVATHSSTTTPLFYRLTAVWSSQEGSLLLWVLLLSLWSSAILFATRRSLREVAPYATAVLLGFGAFFCALLVFLESPFATLAAPPAEGTGLNPLLRHPSMMIHPPMLYSGYTLFAVPFAFAIGALVTRRLGSEWIRSTRPFTLAAWIFLGFGVLLGARWSYMELGWGGYWAWDPVENASLMPWLTGTAFLHSVMIQEKRGMLKVWNVSLVLATGVLAILGTFLVRSGILESIHAFGASTLGIPFLVLIAVMIAGSIALVVEPRGVAALRAPARLAAVARGGLPAQQPGARRALLRRLLGHVLPAHLRGVHGRGGVGRAAMVQPLHHAAGAAARPALGDRAADRVAARDRREPQAQLRAAGRRRRIGTVVAAGRRRRHRLGARAADVRFAAFVLAGGRAGAVARRRRAARDVERLRAGRAGLARAPQPRGATAATSSTSGSRCCSSAWRRRPRSRPSTWSSCGRARPTASATRRSPTRSRPRELVAASNGRLERIDLGAQLRVQRGDGAPQTVQTYKSYFPSTAPDLGPISRFFEGEATSEVGLQAGIRRDLWTAVAPDIGRLRPRIDEGDKVFADADELSADDRSAFLAQALAGLTRSYTDDPPPATFRFIASPMVTWIWLGGLIVLAGALIALWPAGARAGRPATAAGLARVARELERA